MMDEVAGISLAQIDGSENEEKVEEEVQGRKNKRLGKGWRTPEKVQV